MRNSGLRSATNASCCLPTAILCAGLRHDETLPFLWCLSCTPRYCLASKTTGRIILEVNDIRATNATGSLVLNWDVFVTPGIPIVMADRPPGGQETYFQAMASTLICGEKDAVLVDAYMTAKQAKSLANWVASKGKSLTTIYITHGHGDHWFGVGTLLERFPHTEVVATAKTIEVMRRNASPQFLHGAWEQGFPGQIPENLVMAQALNGNVIDLEGYKLVIVELGHTDTDHTTCLHVPSIGLVVAGDAAYNDVHLYLAETNAQTRIEWIAALDKIESLNPTAVVACHKRPENDDDPRIIEETRQYIRDFDRLAEATGTAQELYDAMLALYPNRVNPGWALWSSVRAAKPSFGE
jgi:glyoxylase-like metal-dependent hydrolase (beta-lactamase superfamily II)